MLMCTIKTFAFHCCLRVWYFCSQYFHRNAWCFVSPHLHTYFRRVVICNFNIFAELANSNFCVNIHAWYFFFAQKNLSLAWMFCLCCGGGGGDIQIMRCERMKIITYAWDCSDTIRAWNWLEWRKSCSTALAKYW